jgi:hypothetical protein
MRAPREGVSPVVWRVAGEVAFLIAVAVALGLANLSWWAILLAMAGALAIVCVIEWVGGREELTFARPAPAAAPVHPVVEAQRADDTEEHEALGWTAFEEAQEPSDAMTIIGAPPREEADEPAASDPLPEEPDPDDEPEPELPPAAHEPDGRRHWWRRRSEVEREAQEAAAEQPRHVRVLPTDADPWEQGFDEPVSAEADEVGEPDEETEEPALVQQSGRRRFRRR